MLFLFEGILKEGSEERMLELRDEWNEHLAQKRVALSGVLRGRDGKRIGYLGLIEAEDFDEAESFKTESPFYRYDLYERVLVAHCEVEIGAIG